MRVIHSDYGPRPQLMSLMDPDSFLFVFRVCSSTAALSLSLSLSLPLSSLSSLCGFVSVAVQLWFFPGLCCSPTSEQDAMLIACCLDLN
jgi:hypothetical protein